MIIELSDAITLIGGTGVTSAAASWAAMRVTLTYMKRDIREAKRSGDRANFRLDNMGVKPGMDRYFDREDEREPS